MLYFLRRKKNKGSTLVELVVSMALTAILATAVVTVMHPAVSIFMKVQKHSRAQIVADTVADTLRTECASSYIHGYGDARVVSVEAADDYQVGDDTIFGKLNGLTAESAADGNVLLIRKNEGYAEALYCNAWISQADHEEVYAADEERKNGNVTSKAVYRLFPNGAGDLDEDEMPIDTRPGYLHSGLYETSSLGMNIDGKNVNVAYPSKAYDYTDPFSWSVYSGFTIDVTYSDFKYESIVPGSDSLADKRPAYVVANIKVYDGSYTDRSINTLIYSRQAVLCFAQDNVKE